MMYLWTSRWTRKAAGTQKVMKYLYTWADSAPLATLALKFPL